MATYAVTIEASVLIEADNATEAFGKLDSAVDSSLWDALSSVGDDVQVNILEPEEQ